MSTKVEQRHAGTAIEDMISILDHATHPREVELIADYLGEAGDARAIRPLLMHLGDYEVQHDADVEDAVCGALMSLGVMCRSGDNCFHLRPRRVIPDDVADAIRELSGAIPWQYFGTRRI